MNNYIRNIAYIAISPVFFSFIVLLITRPYHNPDSFFRDQYPGAERFCHQSLHTAFVSP